jgi:hypothetical protein
MLPARAHRAHFPRAPRPPATWGQPLPGGVDSDAYSDRLARRLTRSAAGSKEEQRCARAAVAEMKKHTPTPLCAAPADPPSPPPPRRRDLAGDVSLSGVRACVRACVRVRVCCHAAFEAFWRSTYVHSGLPTRTQHFARP